VQTIFSLIMDGILSGKLSRHVNLLNSVDFWLSERSLCYAPSSGCLILSKSFGLVLIVAGLIEAVHDSGEQNA